MKLTLIERANSALDKLDSLSLQLAIKTCAAIVISQALALWLDLSATIVAVTVIMLQTRYIGNTLDKSILRFIGGLGGAFAALVVMSLFPQERFLFIGTISLLTTIGIYLQQGSRYPYAWLIAVVSLVLVSTIKIVNQDPYGTFDFAATWVSSIGLGVTVILVIHSVFWPNFAGSDFEDELKLILGKTRTLISYHKIKVLEGRPQADKIIFLEKELIVLLKKVHQTLSFATLETGRFHNFQRQYENLLIQLEALVGLTVEFGETINACYQFQSLGKILAESELLHDELHKLDTMLEELIIALQDNRSGTSEMLVAEYKEKIHKNTVLLSRELTLSIADVMEVSTLLAMIAKLKKLSNHIVNFHAALSVVESKQIEIVKLTPLVAKSHVSFNLKSMRLRKSLLGGLVVVLASTLWIMTNWPYAYKMILFAIVPVLVNAMVPWLPPRPLVKSLIFGGCVAFLLYFKIMPMLDGYTELAFVLIVALFPFCYFINSPRPTTAAMSMLAGLWVIELIAISQDQTYSFTDFSNQFIGISGGFGLALITLAIFSPRVPEKEFIKSVTRFFAICKMMVDQLEQHKPWTAEGESIIQLRAKELVDQIKLCSMWTAMLNYTRVPANSKLNIDSLLRSMNALLFRLTSLEQAKKDFKDESLISVLKSHAKEIRQVIVETFAIVINSILNNEQVPGLPQLKELEDKLSINLTSLAKHADVNEEEKRHAGKIMALVGFYSALSAAITECCYCVNNIDWYELKQSYF